MSKILTMHQPNFFPWIGFFHKLAHADVFVILDDVQVPGGGSYANRTQIKMANGAHWMTMPLPKKGRYRYCNQPLLPLDRWANKTWKTLTACYAGSPYWNYSDFDACFSQAIEDSIALSDFNVAMIHWALDALDIHPPMALQSFMPDISGKNFMIAIGMCRYFDCDVYLSGTGARAYNDPGAFEEAGIELRYQEFACPEYPQRFGLFEPNLSILDLIFNCGPEAGGILR